MPEVYIPKDLTQVQNKVIFGLTRASLCGFSLAAVVSVPTLSATRQGRWAANTAMVLLIVSALPFFSRRCTGKTVSRWNDA